jgi:hypothetical protein
MVALMRAVGSLGGPNEGRWVNGMGGPEEGRWVNETNTSARFDTAPPTLQGHLGALIYNPLPQTI